MLPATPYLELKAVDAYLGPRLVFENLNLRLLVGENTVILGPNGSGKSALIKLLSREIYPVVKTGSSLRIFGEETVNLWDLRGRIGMVSSDLHAHYGGSITASDVVLSGFFGSVGIGRSQQPSAGQRKRVEEIISQLRLEEVAERAYGQLSDGQRLRLLLARAMIHKPQVLVLDEPSNGLDLKSKHELLESLRTLAHCGTTLLLVTHQIETIIPEISRCILLSRGKVFGDGPIDELLQDDPLSNLFNTPLKVYKISGYHQVLPAEGKSSETAVETLN